eukprot:TRINITY_DN11453_c0_g1_i2.p1 TRINITY_DN11453_c0_g1~~TRINITY_DN11453_c0_g1_i2.p1  ORF type:complete len:188 (+),score=25.35 TRINITY_DN11453_c0_g1_i2:79-642(+)
MPAALSTPPGLEVEPLSIHLADQRALTKFGGLMQEDLMAMRLCAASSIFEDDDDFVNSSCSNSSYGRSPEMCNFLEPTSEHAGALRGPELFQIPTSRLYGANLHDQRPPEATMFAAASLSQSSPILTGRQDHGWTQRSSVFGAGAGKMGVQYQQGKSQTRKKAKFCPWCGQQRAESHLFCASCGNKL